MHVTFAPSTLVGFCLVLVRAGAFVVLCPPFNAPAIPLRVRTGFSVALAFLLGGRLGAEVTDLSTAALIGALFTQILAGLALAAFVFVIFQAIQSAGELIDLQVGFSMGALLDPLSGNMSAPIGRLHQLLGITILFAINGHVLVTRAFIETVYAAPMGHIDTTALAAGLLKMVTTLFVASLEIALPVVTALFCTEVALGLLGKAAPQLNILVIGFGVKAMLAFSLLAATLVLLPATTDSLISQGLRAAGKIFEG